MGSSWKKKRDNYYHEKLRQYEQISRDYELGLKWEEYQPIAWAYADQKAQSEKGWFDSIFSGNIFEALFNIVVVAVGIVFSVVTYGASSWISIAAIAGGVASLAYSFYAMNLKYKLPFIQAQANRINSMQGSLETLEKAKFAKDQLTHWLIYCPYEIFADGNIYKAQSAGSESYSPSIAYDTSKGILGEYHINLIDEKLNNRGHYEQGGNEGYFAKVFSTQISLSKFDLSLEARQDTLENNMKRANKRIAEGFNKLNELYFNVLGTAQSIYERIFREQVEVFYGKMITNDFLEKTKNYQKAKRANFNFLHKKHFKGKKKTAKEILAQIEKLKDHYKNVQESDLYTLDEKAWEYYGSILMIQEVFRIMDMEAKVGFYAMFLEEIGTDRYKAAKLPRAKESFGEKVIKEANEKLPKAKESFEKYLKTKAIKEAKESIKDYEEWRAIAASYPNSIYKNPLFVETTAFELPFLESFVHLKVSVMRKGLGGKYALSTPLRTKKVADILEEIKDLSPANSVLYYQRKIQKRVLSKDFSYSYSIGDGGYVNGKINKKILLFEEESDEGSYFGFLDLNNEEFEILSTELPMNEALKEYDWSKLDQNF